MRLARDGKGCRILEIFFLRDKLIYVFVGN